MRKKLNHCLTAALFTLLVFGTVSCSQDSSSDGGFEASLVPVRNVIVNPEAPYDAIHYGLFDYQNTSSTETPRNGNSKTPVVTKGRYSIYIPEGAQPKSKAVVVLTPDNTTAREFARSEIGTAWMKLAHETKEFAVAFVEPVNGGKWNTSLTEGDATKDPSATNPRDERAFIYDVYKSIRNKDLTANAFYSVDKSGITLLGYNEGATMASVLAASWPSMFPNTILIEPTAVEKETLDKVWAEGAYPHINDSDSGYDAVKNGEIGMPVYIKCSDAVVKDGLVNAWKNVNDNAIMHDSTLDAHLLAVTELLSDNVRELYELASNNNRFLGYSGGTVRERIDFSDKRFETHNEKIEGDALGLIRRWSVYTPSSYKAETPAPMVVILHGSSAAITDIAEESRWCDVAEKNGIVLLFVQGYPSTSSPGSKAPIPAWAVFNYADNNPDTVYIGLLMDKVMKVRNIDAERVYLTGHSLGSMMTTTVMGSNIAHRFAAFGPIGAFFTPNTAAPNDIPVWAMLGEWESAMYGAYKANWIKYMGFEGTDPVTAFEEGYHTEKYETETYSDAEGVPMMKYTVVTDSPHTYMAEQSQMLWNDYFSHFKRVDGKVSYTKEN
jgi:Poly(3-hydroxybutyrate) depolymerase